MKPRIYLVMIVKNEAHCIKRCLDSCLPILDGYFIHDTGSTDSTIDIVRECLWAIPGVVAQEPWINFAHNRNRVYEDALRMFGPDAYFLSMDADDELMDEGFDAERDLGYGLYSIGRGGDVMRNYPELLAYGGCGRWQGVIHESFASGIPAKKLKTLWIRVHHEGNRALDPDKFKKDAETLKEALETETDQAEARRLRFQLAQVYEDDRDYERALRAYGQFLREFPNILQELEWNALCRLGTLMEITDKPRKDVISIYHQAITSRPNRVEPYVLLARYFLKIGMPQAACEIAEIACKITEPPEGDTLCILESFYTRENKAVLKDALAALSEGMGHEHEHL
jgi:glycosyltransferase involved in cell wall biosynthesis